jgi:hypothetical protein
VQVKLDVEAASGVADSGDPEQDLTGLLTEIGEVAQARRARVLTEVEQNGSPMMSPKTGSRPERPVRSRCSSRSRLRPALHAEALGDRLSYARLDRRVSDEL